MGENTALWDSVFKTDPAFTKQFSRAGGFSGTAISPMYLMRRATEVFGPIGIGWGFREVESKVTEGVWFSRVQLWYLYAGDQGQVEQWGATTMVNKRKDGSIFVDEEAAKKSVTDAVTKCLSYLGFAADVHMGLYDDNKYVAELREEKKKQTKDEREAGIAAAKEVAERKIKEMAPAGSEPPKSRYTKMLESIKEQKAQFIELDQEQRYYLVLESFGMKKSNEIKSLDKGFEVYKKLIAELKAIRESIPIPGQEEPETAA